MKKVIRLTESDLMRIVKRVIQEDVMATPTKINANPSSLLNNDSESYNKQIGVKTLPSCFKYSVETQQAGIYDSELDILIDLLDWPMSQDDINAATQWSQGNGFPGIFGGQGNYGDLKLRIVNVNGLWYPAVEDLRVKYNLDEYFETLGGISNKEGLGKFRNSLLQAYQYWIDCVNKV